MKLISDEDAFRIVEHMANETVARIAARGQTKTQTVLWNMLALQRVIALAKEKLKENNDG